MAVFAGFAALMVACPAQACGDAAQAARADAAAIEQGVATWYGPRHAGHRTTSGAVFDPHKMTAAHHSLPMGSWVRVTDDATGRSVVVLVNDREPPHGIRCIDLSEEAARRLGIHGRGVADVTLYAASPGDAGPDAVEVAEAPLPAHRLSARRGPQHKRHARP